MENKPKKREPEEFSPDSESENNGNIRKLGLFSAILVDLIGFTAAGVGLGYLAWVKWGAPWWVLLLSTLAGLSLAFYKLYLISKKEL